MNPSYTKFIALFTAVLLVGFVAGSTRAANLTSVSDTLSRQAPSSISVTHTITFKPATPIAAPGSIKITFDSGFDLASVISSSDVTVSGGGVTWNAVANGDLNAATNVLTLGWNTGTLPAGSAVTVVVSFAKNPAVVGNYNITVATGPSGFVTATDSRTIPVIIASGGVTITASVPYPPTDPTITNITPAETIIISSGTAQVISFDLTDVNMENIDYTVTPSTGTISVSPAPATPVSGNTFNGITVTFTYFADGGTGAQTITITANDDDGNAGDTIVYNINLFII